MKFSISLEGLDALEALPGKSNQARQAIARAMHDDASTVLNESKRIVPVDLGTLKNSGKVSRPKVTANEIEVDITYGGAAAPYAIYVHENPEARHAPGKTYKYLERPMMAHADKFARNVKIAFLAWLKGGI